jgi:hypothetical protein
VHRCSRRVLDGLNSATAGRSGTSAGMLPVGSAAIGGWPLQIQLGSASGWWQWRRRLGVGAGARADALVAGGWRPHGRGRALGGCWS